MASDKKTTTYSVTGYFRTRATATQAVDALETARFTKSQIILAFRPEEEETGNEEQEGVTIGEKTKNLWENLRAFFADESKCDLYDKEQSGGDFYCVAGAPVHGGYADLMIDFRNSVNALSVSEEHARYFSRQFNRGSEAALVTVAAQCKEDEAERILERFPPTWAENYTPSLLRNPGARGRVVKSSKWQPPKSRRFNLLDFVGLSTGLGRKSVLREGREPRSSDVSSSWVH